MKLADIIREGAAHMKGRAAVRVSRRYDAVRISDPAGLEADIFMQGQKASDFTDHAEELWDKAGEVTLNECYLHMARGYVDYLWNKRG